MKVNTEIKSGNLITDAANWVSEGAAQVVDFVSAADQQANAVTDTLSNTLNSAWNSLTGWFRR